MGGVSLFFDYFKWHYSRAFMYVLVIWGNFLWFTVHFFSLPLLVRTLFSPWKRMHEEYRKTGPEDFFATIVVNIMTRVIGFLVRMFVLVFGVFTLFILTLLLVIWLVVWVFLPILIPVLLVYGLTFLSL